MTHFFGIVGKSDSGKTMLVENIIPLLTAMGLKTGVIKHTHHNFETDKRGSDTHRHKNAGAGTVVLASPENITVFKQTKTISPVDLKYLFTDKDIVLVEGFKKSPINKIEVIRSEVSTMPVCVNDPHLLAFVSDIKNLKTSLPVFSMEDYEKITDFIIKHSLENN